MAASAGATLGGGFPAGATELCGLVPSLKQRQLASGRRRLVSRSGWWREVDWPVDWSGSGGVVWHGGDDEEEDE